MSSEWKESTLGSIAEITMGQSPKGDTCSKNYKGLPLLNGPSEFGTYYPIPVQYTIDPKKKAQPGDLLFCVRGSTGRMNWADQNYAIGRGLASIRHKGGNKFQPFLKALIDYLLPTLLSSATGTVFSNLTGSQLINVKILIPSIEEQEAIADIFSAIDDKIELNRQMCKTLEDIACALFKSWFIDFDPVRAKADGRIPEGLNPEITDLFPDRFIDTPMGRVPDGWRVTSLKDEFDIIMGQSPPGETYNETGVGLPFFQGSRDFGFRFPVNRIFCSAPKRVSRENDTLVSVRAPVGDVNRTLEKCCIGRGVCAIRNKQGLNSFAYYSLKSIKRIFKTHESNGTVFGSINKIELEKIKLVLPINNIIIKEFESFASIVDEQVKTLSNENDILSKTRDIIIPKILSGSIKINESEFKLS